MVQLSFRHKTFFCNTPFLAITICGILSFNRKRKEAIKKASFYWRKDGSMPAQLWYQLIAVNEFGRTAFDNFIRYVLLNLFGAEAYTICLIHKAALQVFQMPIRPKACFCLQKFAAFLFLRIIDL
jgi:hypothetical protein